jgi:hypothetical protein
MPRSDERRPVDWRGWIALAWVVWFGVLYGKMVVESRGGAVLASLVSPGPHGSQNPPGPESGTRQAR